MIYFRFFAYSKSYCFIISVSFKSFTSKRTFHFSHLKSRDPQVSLYLCDWILVSDESRHLLFEIFSAISRPWLANQPRSWGRVWVLVQRSLTFKEPCHGCFTSFNREFMQRRRRRRRERERQKAIGLDWQNNNFARASRFLYISLRSVHDYDVKGPIFTFTWTQDNEFCFLFLAFDSLLEFNSRKNYQLMTNWTRWNIWGMNEAR